jgi:hypothetical protein
MKSKEKAKELFDKYYTELPDFAGYQDLETAKQCALIAVDEILKLLYSLKFGNALSEEIEYWEEVKHELTKQQEQ